MRYYQSEVIYGQPNKTVYGNGLTSTEAEKKRINKIYLVADNRAGNYFEGWIEKERVLNIEDSLIPIHGENFRIGLEVDIDLEVGKTFKPALRCGGTANKVIVVYEYEVTT